MCHRGAKVAASFFLLQLKIEISSLCYNISKSYTKPRRGLPMTVCIKIAEHIILEYLVVLSAFSSLLTTQAAKR